MFRRSSPLVILAALTAGAVLGVAVDRSGPFVAAQATDRSRPDSPPTTLTTGRQAEAKAEGDEDKIYRTLERQYNAFEQIDRTFELVAKAVSPAVVHIVALKTTRSEESPHVRRYEETGSGVIVRGDRGRETFVLTNNHVIEGGRPEKIDIFLQDGRSIHPLKIWLDAKADIAVLSLGREDLPVARFGDSDAMKVGTWVLALGSPFGLTHSVSQGIISARGRHMDELQDVENQDFLQTDAAINPGNSGGPLVNMKGEVIGINNSIASTREGNEGVGFSIPINLAHWIMNQLLSNGRVSRGGIGIYLHREFRPEDALEHGLDRPQGAWIDFVHPHSPAEAGGLRDGDIILRFKGVEVHDLNHLINMVSMAPIGEPADVVVWRDRKTLSFRVTVGDRERTISQVAPPPERPLAKGLLRRPDRPAAAPPAALGLEFATLDATSASRIGLPPNDNGAVITKVDPQSPLAGLFRPNDVISSVDGQQVHTADDAAQALNRNQGLKPLHLEFDRVVKGTIERRSVRVP